MRTKLIFCTGFVLVRESDGILKSEKIIPSSRNCQGMLKIKTKSVMIGCQLHQNLVTVYFNLLGNFELKICIKI